MSSKYPIFYAFILIAFAFAFSSPHASFAQVSQTQFVDSVPPTITLPASPVIDEASGPQGSIVNFNALATDDTSKNISAQCIPPSGSTFRLGDTTVECTAVDGAGNENRGSFTVRVQDTIPPSTVLEDHSGKLDGASGQSGKYDFR